MMSLTVNTSGRILAAVPDGTHLALLYTMCDSDDPFLTVTCPLKGTTKHADGIPPDGIGWTASPFGQK